VVLHSVQSPYSYKLFCQVRILLEFLCEGSYCWELLRHYYCRRRCCWPGQLRRYSNSLRAGRSGDRIPGEPRVSDRPDRPWSPPSLLYNGYRVFQGGKESPGRDADPSPLLVPWSRKSRAIPLLPHGPYGLYIASVPVQWCTFKEHTTPDNEAEGIATRCHLIVSSYCFNTNNSNSPIVQLFGFKKVLISTAVRILTIKASHD